MSPFIGVLVLIIVMVRLVMRMMNKGVVVIMVVRGVNKVMVVMLVMRMMNKVVVVIDNGGEGDE